MYVVLKISFDINTHYYYTSLEYLKMGPSGQNSTEEEYLNTLYNLREWRKLRRQIGEVFDPTF